MECPQLNDPENGKKNGTSSVCESTVSYYCLPGYDLVGNRHRSCLNNGSWTGSLPVCVGEKAQCLLYPCTYMYHIWISPVCAVDINECLSAPCLNAGTCIDEVNGFTCFCRADYRGVLCESRKSCCTYLSVVIT